MKKPLMRDENFGKQKTKEEQLSLSLKLRVVIYTLKIQSVTKGRSWKDCGHAENTWHTVLGLLRKLLTVCHVLS